jgi:hypothetical protein
MRGIAVIAGIAAFAAIATAPLTAFAETPNGQAPSKKRPPVVMRSASGTIIQPTRTIIHNQDGTTTVITVPRRSYLDPGTEVPVGYGSHMDYAFPTGGNPGEPYSYFGPDLGGIGGIPLAQPWLIPGFTPGYPSPY